jgi:hypothetical protein
MSTQSFANPAGAPHLHGAGEHAGAEDEFLALSVALTGFDVYELQGTGVAGEYFTTLWRIVPDAAAELMQVWRTIVQDPPPGGVEEGVRTRILDSTRLGPVAQNVITMWYTGQWVPLPDAWHYAYGTPPEDENHVVSALAYQESLMWKAAGTNPMGAKQPGFGTWALPPRP